MGWADALQGAGAWLGGNGPQYMQAQAIKAQAQSEQEELRRQAFIQEGLMAESMIKNGRPDQALALFESRVQAGEKLPPIAGLGGNFDASKSIRDMLRAGDVNGALTQLSVGNQILRDAGIIAVDDANNQKGQTFAVTNPETGQIEMVGSVFDPRSGQWTAQRVPMGGGEIVGPSGVAPSQRPGQRYAETAAEQAARLGYAGQIAGAEAGARADVEAATAPKIAADTTAAQEEAKADVGRDTQSRITERSGRALNAAADLVMAAFEDVNTGPVWGRVPAAMRDATAYQTAEGAAGQYRAQMRKIIRPPGSGPWTDLDEQKLDQIVPNLQDTREAVAAKIAQGRALYDAQVGGAQGNASNAPRETPRRRSTDTPNVVNWDDL